MNRLVRIARSAKPSTAVLFRKQAYGRQGVRDFLRDVVALANAAVDGPRYIVTGIDFDPKGRRRIHAIDEADFSGKPAYQALVADHVEPPVRVRYQAVTIEGERVGVFEIADCQDRPYMMRIDYSETLRRGDAYIRVNEAMMKMGRRQLQAMFEEKFRESVSAASIEVGFPGEIIHKNRRIPTATLDQLPSALASAKLHELIRARERVEAAAANTFVARLTHARLFGSDRPYEERTTEDIAREMRQIERRYQDHDAWFLFEQHGTGLQIVVLNQGEEALRDAAISLVLPNHSALYVATELPKLPKDESFIPRSPAERAKYPAVNLRDDSILATAKLGDIEPGMPTEVFAKPLLICVGDDLAGRRVGIQYSLFAQNLRSPAKGKLRLLF